MKILWVCPTLLHPTNNGSQIRTLGILRHLSKSNEIHFAGLARRNQTTDKSGEYCAKLVHFVHEPPKRNSVAFAAGAVRNIFSDVPLNVYRYYSPLLLREVNALLAAHRYDVIVADFLLSAPNVPALQDVVLFQHNVESRIMERLASINSSPLLRRYLSYLTKRLENYERKVCSTVKHVITVSNTDSAYLRDHYGVKGATAVPTGVNVDFFRRPPVLRGDEPTHDIVFVGSMDYLPNEEGVLWFAANVLPRIRERRPETTLGLVGKNPTAAIQQLTQRDSRTVVTGTVSDVRPYLWGANLSVVPLFSGSGTRLKIYEAMAAAVPVVSTSIGAEGLTYENGRNIVIADDPQSFATACLDLLNSPERRHAVGQAAHHLVASSFDWSVAAKQFEDTLRGVIA